MVLKPESITMVATDGHRLAHVERGGEKFDGVSGELKTLIPKKAMDEFKSLLDSTDAETIEFAKDESTLFFRIGSRLLTSRQLTGQFPNFEAVLPKDNSKIVHAARRRTDCRYLRAWRSSPTSARARSACAWKKANSSFPHLPPKPASPKILSRPPTTAKR